MKQIIFGALSGLLFGAGLTISTMVDPQRVIGFLDILGDWDPSLAFVMGGALLVYFPLYFFLIKSQKHTLFNESCDIPTNNKIDKKLIIGASLFGMGWGLSGICPGPALTNLSAMNPGIMIFVLTMFVGFWLGDLIEK